MKSSAPWARFPIASYLVETVEDVDRLELADPRASAT